MYLHFCMFTMLGIFNYNKNHYQESPVFLAKHLQTSLKNQYWLATRDASMLCSMPLPLGHRSTLTFPRLQNFKTPNFSIRNYENTNFPTTLNIFKGRVTYNMMSRFAEPRHNNYYYRCIQNHDIGQINLRHLIACIRSKQ